MSLLLIEVLLVCDVFMRALTNEWGLLPKAFNVVDIVIVAALIVAALNERDKSIPLPHGILWRLITFNVVLVLGALFNPEWFNASPALAQWIMWNQPLFLFLALWHLQLPVTAFDRYATLLRRLIVIQAAIGILQIPNSFKYGDREEIIGTFYGNATQYQGFLMLGLFLLISTKGKATHNTILRRIAFAIGLLLILAIDNKASWPGVLIALFAVLALSQENRETFARRAKLITAWACIALLLIISVQKLSPSLDKYTRLEEAWQTGNIRNIGKIKAIRDVFASWKQHITMVFIGSGPATFYSRSGRQFYAWMGSDYRKDRKTGDKYMDLRRERSFSMEGVVTASSVPAFYYKFYADENQEIFPIGSSQADEPFSSYAGLLGETGLLGTLLYLGIYVVVGRHLFRAYRANLANESRRAFIACTIGFLIYTLFNCIYNSWLETTRMTTILWSMIALSLRFMSDQPKIPQLTRGVEGRKVTRISAKTFGSLAADHSTSPTCRSLIS